MRTERHIHLDILTPEGSLLDADDIGWIRAELRDGQIGILPDHAPLLGELVPGVLTYADGVGVHELPLDGGILWIHGGDVRILTGGAAEEKPQRPESDLTERLERLEKPVGDLLSRELGIVDEGHREGST